MPILVFNTIQRLNYWTQQLFEYKEVSANNQREKSKTFMVERNASRLNKESGPEMVMNTIVVSKYIIVIPFNKHGIRATSQLGLDRNTSQNGKR